MVVDPDGNEMEEFPRAEITIIGESAALFYWDPASKSMEQHDRLRRVRMERATGDVIRYTGTSDHLANTVGTDDNVVTWVVTMKGCQDC